MSNVILLTNSIDDHDSIGTYTIGAVGYPDCLDQNEAERELRQLFSEWKEINPNPETDSEFVDWLDENTQYVQLVPPHIVCLDAD